MSSIQVILELLKYVKKLEKKLKYRLFIALLVLMIGIICAAITPLILRYIINSLEKESIPFKIWIFISIAYGINWIIHQIAIPIVWLLCQRPVDRMASLICTDIFNHLQQVPTSFFYTEDSKKPITALERTFQTIPLIFSSLIIYFLPAFSELLIAFFIFLKLYGFLYAALMIILVVSFLACTIYISYKVKKPDQEYHFHLDQLNKHIADAIIYHETITLFAAEESELKKLDYFLRKFENSASKRAYLLDGIQSVQTICCGIVLIAFTGIAIYSVASKLISSGDFVLINSYVIQFITPLTFLGYIYSSVYRGLSNLKKSFDIFKIPLAKYSGNINFILNKNDIFFDSIFFKKGEQEIIKGVSFKLQQGKKLAIIGDSGSGKSTCIRLLMRLFEPTSGSIYIGGENIKDIHPYALRKQIGIVPQDPTIFQGTLEENLLYGNPEASLKDIKKIISKVKLDDLVNRLPDGIQTSFSEHAIQLSGGEKQRLALARIMLKKPEIYIFDEATSALDLHTETEIIEQIKELVDGKTTLFITHRLKMALLSDYVLVFRKGKIIEAGTHEELIKKGKYYAGLWEEQCSIN